MDELNAKELHSVLDDVINQVRENSLKTSMAKEISNAAGKKIALAKVQMDYAVMWDSKVKIPFLHGDIEPRS